MNWAELRTDPGLEVVIGKGGGATVPNLSKTVGVAARMRSEGGLKGKPACVDSVEAIFGCSEERSRMA